MKNIDRIKQMTAEELATFLCNLMCNECCENRCPAQGFCRFGHTGMLEWLESEEEQ